MKPATKKYTKIKEFDIDYPLSEDVISSYKIFQNYEDDYTKKDQAKIKKAGIADFILSNYGKLIFIFWLSLSLKI